MIKTLDGATMPALATEGSAGLDLASHSDVAVYAEHRDIDIVVNTGVYLEIPVGYVGILVERSSLHKSGLTLANNVGIIDSDYRGEIQIALRNTTHGNIKIAKGQRIAQLVIVAIPQIRLTRTDILNETTRDTGGFGSTGY